MIGAAVVATAIAVIALLGGSDDGVSAGRADPVNAEIVVVTIIVESATLREDACARDTALPGSTGAVGAAGATSSAAAEARATLGGIRAGLADGALAAVTAPVAVHEVRIITGLGGGDDAIPAAGATALEAETTRAALNITAAGGALGIETEIRRAFTSLLTGFADGPLAAGTGGVSVIRIAVVADFGGGDNAIPALCAGSEETELPIAALGIGGAGLAGSRLADTCRTLARGVTGMLLIPQTLRGTGSRDMIGITRALVADLGNVDGSITAEADLDGCFAAVAA